MVTINNQKYLEFTTTHFSLYAIIGAISNADPSDPSGPSGPTGYFGTFFSKRTLVDPKTGITITGLMLPETTLQVSMLDPDASGTFGDTVRQYSKNQSDTVYLAANAKASLSTDFGAPLSLSIPVGKAHNGQTVTLLQVVNGKAETLTAVVKDGSASFKVTSLGSFALFVPTKMGDDVEIPQTGDQDTPYGIFYLIGAAVLAGAIAFRRRSRT